MGEEKDGVVYETPQEQRKRERELLSDGLPTAKGVELKELLAMITIAVVVISVTVVVIVFL